MVGERAETSVFIPFKYGESTYNNSALTLYSLIISAKVLKTILPKSYLFPSSLYLALIEFNIFYKGQTQDLISRLKQHKSGEVKSTKSFIPWEIVYFEKFNSRIEAVEREKYFKTAAGRRFLKQVVKL